MANNAKTIVIGVAFAILAIGVYELVYQRGIWGPNSASRSTIADATGRADRIIAQQARANLDAFFAKAEKGEKLDIDEFRKAIEAVAKDAGELEKLYEAAEVASHGQVTAPEPVTQPPVQLAQIESPPQKVDPVVPPHFEPTNDGFFGSAMTFGGNASQVKRWTRVKHELKKPFALQIDGELHPWDETLTHSRRTAFGFRGLRWDELTLTHTEFNTKGKPGLDAPEANYLALIGRYCDLEGCDLPFAVTNSPFVVCPKQGKWLEIKLNRHKEMTSIGSGQALGEILVRPMRLESYPTCGDK